MRIAGALVLMALLACLAGSAAAQEPGPEPGAADIAVDVRGIRQALERLAGLLEAVEFQQRVDVLLQRIEMRERRLEPLERRLRSAQSEVESLGEELKTLERMREQNEDHLQEEIRDGTDSPRSGTRRMLEDIDRTLTGLEERSESARLRMQQLENELAGGRREIEILDEMLLELLEEER